MKVHKALKEIPGTLTNKTLMVVDDANYFAIMSDKLLLMLIFCYDRLLLMLGTTEIRKTPVIVSNPSLKSSRILTKLVEASGFGGLLLILGTTKIRKTPMIISNPSLKSSRILTKRVGVSGFGGRLLFQLQYKPNLSNVRNLIDPIKTCRYSSNEAMVVLNVRYDASYYRSTMEEAAKAIMRKDGQCC
ncbi:hypothetical protein IFM89_022247 [Coptis chinensis]|uniref:Uncharacterized protein n=1 Tax=Coptis chinensis TaxID=261450 RepID=A0A835HDJ5_9MAGN|nr:hypothetical protein IFM89_022247 [Coptis chinensis]